MIYSPFLRIILSFVTFIEQVAPIEIHKENLMDVEEQLRFLIHVIKGTQIIFSLPLLKGSFTSWLWNNLGIHVGLCFFDLYIKYACAWRFKYQESQKGIVGVFICYPLHFLLC